MKNNEITKELINLKEKIDKKVSDKYIDSFINLITNEYHSYIEKLLDKNVDKLDDIDIDNMGYILSISNIIYSMTSKDTGLNDREYDSLKEKYENIKGEVINRDDNAYTDYPSLRGTLTKIYRLTDEDELKNSSQKSIEEWITTITNKLNKNGKDKYESDIWDEEVFVCPKFDGVSAVCEYNEDGELTKAVTRGDIEANKAKDITHIMNRLPDTAKGLFKGKKHGLKVEVIMKDSDLDSFNEEFGTKYTTARACVSGILNSLKHVENDKLKYIHAIHLRYSFLNEEGEESEQHIASMLNDFPNLNCKLKNTSAIRNFSFNNSNVYGFRCDGSVIVFKNKILHSLLGRENGKMMYEVAYKFTEETEVCTIDSIKYTVGFTGKINPVVTFEPVMLKGRIITRASVAYSRLKEHPLKRGDRVKVIYDIIPYIDVNVIENRNKDAKELKLPKTCPECGKHVVESESGMELLCVNPKCGCIKKGRICNYIDTIGIKGISYETVNDLYDRRLLTKIEDLYELKNKTEEMLNIPGYKKKRVEGIINAIEDRTTVYEAELLGSLGIKGFGKKKFHELLQQGTYDGIIEICLNGDWSSLVTYRGIQVKGAKTLAEGIQNNEKTLNALENYLDVLTEPMDLKAGMYVVFSKCRDKELEKWLADRAIMTKNDISGAVDFIIVPNMSSTSTKIEKAKKLKIPLVLIGENGQGVKDYIKSNYRKVN